MPAHVIDLRSADDARDVVHQAVQALAEGRLVGFPTETTYVVAASALSEPGVELLESAIRQPGAGRGKKRKGPPLLSLGIKSAQEAWDYVPDLSPLGQRLARRCWPGPVALVLEDQHPESLLEQLPESVRQRLLVDGMVTIRVPAHRAVQDVMRLLAGPLVLADAPRAAAAGEAVTAQEVVESLDNVVTLVLDEGRSRFGQPASVVLVQGDKYEVVKVGVVSEQNFKRLSSVVILFVCTGNTCRSPMAEALFRHRLAKQLRCQPRELEDRGFVIMSAGISAMAGSRASPEAVDVLAPQGIDLSSHESQPLTEPLILQADLILAMTRSHRDAIISRWPDAADRTRLLSLDGTDVADPIGGPPEVYKQCANQIAAQLDGWLKELKLLTPGRR